jgi:cyclohexa-1,5-dienecarbonyl-CoA hydratase
MSGDGVRLDVSEDGAVQTLTVDLPPGNVFDMAACAELRSVLERAAADRRGKVLVFRTAGKHFSFGASVEEHLPENAEAMLAAIGGVVRALVGFPYPTTCGVQGRCLGGGLELALACGIIIAEDSAILAAPEIQLGVFAPAATALLSGRAAEELLLTGRNMSAREAQGLGIVCRTVGKGGLDDGIDEYVKEHFLPRSASSLRIATKALRGGTRGVAFSQRMDELERLYIDELLPTHDGVEGIQAFLDKRPPQWTNA